MTDASRRSPRRAGPRAKRSPVLRMRPPRALIAATVQELNLLVVTQVELARQEVRDDVRAPVAGSEC